MYNKKYMKDYNKKNCKKISKYQATWYQNNHKEVSKKQASYYENNRRKILERVRIYGQTEAYKTNMKRRYYKRRGLGFYPLNEYFEGWVGHHISQNFVIYMPEEIHRSMYHNIWTGENMEAMNKLAIKFLDFKKN